MTQDNVKLPATEGVPRDLMGTASRGYSLHTGQAPAVQLVLTRARATVGRHPTNDLVLDDPRVSSAHLELERHEGGQVHFRDLDTTNGTYIGTHRVFEAEVGPGRFFGSVIA